MGSFSPLSRYLAGMQRHYGMDWLRIGAFALLILYHVGMVFAPWPYHVKTAEPIEWLALAMKLTNPWRLTLLFVVSGYASRALFTKAGALPGFVGNRSLRLLIPLAFGIVVMVPPQDWVELVTQHNYLHGFGYFLLHDYFRFREVNGVLTPSWNHLWFVAYLWVYTIALALLLVLPRPARAQAAFDRVFSGWRALALPMAWLILTQIVLFHRWSDTHDVIGDGIAHLAYFPAFLFGFALGGSAPVMAAMVRWRGLAAAAAVLGYAIGAGIELVYPGDQVPPQWLGNIMLVASYVQSWGAIVALIGVAERYLNRDHPWRATLTEAVFPFYLIHQTVIVLTEFWIRQLQLNPFIEFIVLVMATIAGCWAFYLAGREVSWLRPLIGLRRLTRSSAIHRAVVAEGMRPAPGDDDEPSSTAKVPVRPSPPRPFPGAAG
jgi:hypothetical protein